MLWTRLWTGPTSGAGAGPGLRQLHSRLQQIRDLVGWLGIRLVGYSYFVELLAYKLRRSRRLLGKK
jgi:hypothetical protein